MTELDTLWAALHGLTLDGFLEVTYDAEHVWIPTGDRARFARAMAAFEGHAVTLGLAPRTRRDPNFLSRAACVWARVESRESLAALKRFRPVPTVVLREPGTVRRTALWALSRPLDYDWVLRANKRLAHRLRCAKKYAAVEFMCPAPGCVTPRGRLVDVAWCEPNVYRAAEVVQGLRDAPDANAWRERAAA